MILTRCSPRDCQMLFGIGRGVTEVQILKNSETGPISWNVLNRLCINIATEVSLTEWLPNVIYFIWKFASSLILIRSSHRDCLSGHGVVTSGEAFKTISVGVVHFSVSWFHDYVYTGLSESQGCRFNGKWKLVGPNLLVDKRRNFPFFCQKFYEISVKALQISAENSNRG